MCPALLTDGVECDCGTDNSSFFPHCSFLIRKLLLVKPLPQLHFALSELSVLLRLACRGSDGVGLRFVRILTDSRQQEMKLSENCS